LEITFIKTHTHVPDFCAPVPAADELPDWYKKQSSYMTADSKRVPLIDEEQNKVNTSSTIKRCMPVFDSMSSGYLLRSSSDVYVKTSIDGTPFYAWPDSHLTQIEFHSPKQADQHPKHNPDIAYPKWVNYWGIKTPEGYASLFVTPLHRDLPFEILPGVVDTDTYNSPVNFPFTLKDSRWEGLIPSGTPIAQVIPFKRDEWTMNFGGDKEKLDQSIQGMQLRTKFFDGYKTMFRKQKSYR
jgi:hypothetical protein